MTRPSTLLILLLGFPLASLAGCEPDAPVTTCELDDDCFEGQRCIDGVCADDLGGDGDEEVDGGACAEGACSTDGGAVRGDGDGDGDVGLVSLVIEPGAQTVRAGEPASFTVTGRDADDNLVTPVEGVVWSSTDPQIATPDPEGPGRFITLAGGTTLVTVTLQGVPPAMATLQVQPAAIVDASTRNKHSLALDTFGRVHAWGWNAHGQCGDSDPTDVGVPIVVEGLPDNVVQVEAGGVHSFVRTVTGRVWAWGRDNSGELGRGGVGVTVNAVAAPVLAADVDMPIAGVDDVAAGYQHALLLVGTDVYAFGVGSNGQLGQGDLASLTRPTLVPGLPPIVRVEAAAFHSFAIDEDGTLWVWGSEDYGQLGTGNTMTSVSSPQVFPAPWGTDVADVAGGWGHTVLLRTGGDVVTVGWGIYGQIGDGLQTDTVTAPYAFSVPGTLGVVAGFTESGVFTSTVSLWGHNEWGQLGRGTTELSGPSPEVVLASGGIQPLSNLLFVDGGADHFLALDDSGTLWAWGRNEEHRQLGDGSGVDAPLPIEVPLLP